MHSPPFSKKTSPISQRGADCEGDAPCPCAPSPSGAARSFLFFCATGRVEIEMPPAVVVAAQSPHLNPQALYAWYLIALNLNIHLLAILPVYISLIRVLARRCRATTLAANLERCAYILHGDFDFMSSVARSLRMTRVTERFSLGCFVGESGTFLISSAAVFIGAVLHGLGNKILLVNGKGSGAVGRQRYVPGDF